MMKTKTNERRKKKKRKEKKNRCSGDEHDKLSRLGPASLNENIRCAKPSHRNQYSRNSKPHHEAAAIGTGAGGELAGALCISTSWLPVPFTFSTPFGVPLVTPLGAFSSVLPSLFCSAFPLVPSLSLTLPLVDASADSPSGLASSGTGLGGAFHLLIPQVTPVKLLS